MNASDRVRAAMRWGAGLTAASLLGFGILSLSGRAGTLHGEDGVVWEAAAAGPEAVQIEPGGPGDQAGIRRGDRLLALEGIRVDTPRGIRDLLWRRGGAPTLYRLARAGAVEETRVVPVSSGEENRLYYYLCVVGLLGLGVGFLLAWKLPFDPSARLLFLLMGAFYLVLVLSPSGAGGILDWAFYWGDLAGRLLAPALLAHFILRVSTGDSSPSPRLRRLAALYLPAAVLLGWNLYLIPLRGVNAFRDPAAAVALKDRLEVFYLAVYSAAVAVLLLFRLAAAPPARVRWRVRWLAFSMMTGLLPLSLLYLLPTALGIPAGTVGELSILPLTLVPLGFAAALLQERTVDLDRSLRLAARYTLGATFVLTGALILSWSASRVMGRSWAGGILAEVVGPVSVSALLALACRRRIPRLVERILGPPVPDATRALLEFRSDLDGELGLSALADGFLKLLSRALDLERAVLLVREGNEEGFVPVPAEGESSLRRPTVRLDAVTAARLVPRELVLLNDETAAPRAGGLAAYADSGFRYLFPMTVRGDLRALLLVGTNRDGSPLSSNQLDVLTALASQAARSMDGARLSRELEVRMEEEKRLRRESRGILEASRLGILLTDSRGKVTAANREAGRILGRGELAGEPVDRLLPRGIFRLLEREGSGAPAAGVQRGTLDTREGTARTLEVTRGLLSSEPGSGHVYTLEDVTEEARREERILRQDHLASVGRLASEVAHEVNTPLTGIASYAQILISRMASRLPEVELLRKIEAQAYRAAGIAGSVLNLARKKDDEPRQLFEAGSLLAECLPLFETHLKGKRIRMVTEREASLPLVHGQKGRIQQAVLNLLLNAADALPQGGEVRVDMAAAGPWLRIRVADDGVGIPPENLARIFEPFFTTKPPGQGTGLGLAVVRKVAQEHGGRIEIDSRPGSGTTMTLLLPALSETETRVARGA